MPDAAPAPVFRYREFDPAPALRQHVTAYWEFETVPGAPLLPHRVWPDGCVSLAAVHVAGRVIHLSVLGPHLNAIPVPVQPGAAYWGVRFWPDTGSAILGVPATALRGRLIPATELLGESAVALIAGLGAASTAAATARALDRWLTQRVNPAPPIDLVVRQVVVEIVATRGERPVAALAAAVALSERQLQRRFLRAVGLTPKQFARIRRLRSAAGAVLDGAASWSTLAAEHGYADQSHLIHEFSQLTGFTPVAFEERLRAITHENVRP